MTAAARAHAFELLPGEPFLFLRASDERMPWAVRQLARRLHAEIQMGMRGASLWSDLVDRWRALSEKAEDWRAANPGSLAAAAGEPPVSAEQAVLDEVERLGSVYGVPIGVYASPATDHVPHVISVHSPLSAIELAALKEEWHQAKWRTRWLPDAGSPRPPESWWSRFARFARRLSWRMSAVGEWLLS